MSEFAGYAIALVMEVAVTEFITWCILFLILLVTFGAHAKACAIEEMLKRWESEFGKCDKMR